MGQVFQRRRLYSYTSILQKPPKITIIEHIFPFQKPPPLSRFVSSPFLFYKTKQLQQPPLLNASAKATADRKKPLKTFSCSDAVKLSKSTRPTSLPTEPHAPWVWIYTNTLRFSIHKNHQHTPLRKLVGAYESCFLIELLTSSKVCLPEKRKNYLQSPSLCFPMYLILT